MRDSGHMNGPAVVLSIMMVLVPAAGMPTEELLQDTLKSSLVAAFTLFASYVWLWRARADTPHFRWHRVLIPLLALLGYALVSMAWSHTYLAGVEAVRWFILAGLVLVGLQCWSLPSLNLLAWGVHLGATLAALWAALQFWFDWHFFAQGPTPASTFVNRNFFAEYLVCSLPFSALLLTRVRRRITVYTLTFVFAFQLVALLMAGTRSALLALLVLLGLAAIIALRLRQRIQQAGWRAGSLTTVLAIGTITVWTLASIPTRLPDILAEAGPVTALQRSIQRGHTLLQSQQYQQGSFAMRLDMWRSTLRMISDHPLTGVGAGAWETEIPRYQNAGTQLETDYYAHNEPLQLVAEYGLLGVLVLLALTVYWLRSAWLTWQLPDVNAETIPRWVALASLLALGLVGCAGFPWRLAGTGALAAVSLGVLAASDLRLRHHSTRTLTTGFALAGLAMLSIVTGVALYIAWQAILCERLLVRAAKVALAINQSADPRDPRWNAEKQLMLEQVRAGIVINPHYRKLTPIVADSLAGWGDWANATWIWESVLRSRPNVPVLCANVARGYLQMGDLPHARLYVKRAMMLQPDAPSVRSLQVMLWAHEGQTGLAVERARILMRQGHADFDLLQVAVALGHQTHDSELAIAALQAIASGWPRRASDAQLRLGALYEQTGRPELAQKAYAAALQASPPWLLDSVLMRIPEAMRPGLTRH